MISSLWFKSMMTVATGVSGAGRGGSQATVGKELIGGEEMVERNKN